MAPRLEDKVTVFPDTGFEPPSLKVTVMVEVEEPLADKVEGEGVTVESEELTAPGRNETDAV